MTCFQAREHPLYVILPYFNFCGFKRRRDLFIEFVERYRKTTGLRLVVVEAMGPSPLGPLPVSKHIRIISDSHVWLKENLINLASMSGPIWLSWVATLRLARTHAITEDYSYKAALAQAFQGYSTSVAEEDELLKYRLFATVITQLDASPVRFVSERHAATPFQDLLQQPWMEEFLKDESIKGKFMVWFRSKFKTPFQSATEAKADQQ